MEDRSKNDVSGTNEDSFKAATRGTEAAKGKNTEHPTKVYHGREVIKPSKD